MASDILERLPEAVRDAITARRAAADELNRALLDCERECRHELVAHRKGCYGDWFNSPGIYICARCRCEWQTATSCDLTESWNRPAGTIFVPPEELGVKDICRLRIDGDERETLSMGTFQKKWATSPADAPPANMEEAQ